MNLALERQKAEYDKKHEIVQKKQQELDVAIAQKVEMLEKISNYSAEEAKAELVESMKADIVTGKQKRINKISKNQKRE